MKNNDREVEHMKKIIVLFIIMSLIIVGCSDADKDSLQVTEEQVIEIKDFLKKTNEKQESYSIYLKKEENIKMDINELLSGYVNYSDLDDGILSVRDSEKDINSIGIINVYGEKLIPCEAAIIERITNRQSGYVSDRYLEVFYTTKKTKNRNECFIYQTDSRFSVMLTEDDIMYKGYAKIYDLKQKKFLDNVKITNAEIGAVQACGDSICVREKNGITKLYNEDGKVLLETQNEIRCVVDGYMLEVVEDKYIIYDENGNRINSTKKSIDLLCDETLYLEEYVEDESGYILLDENINVINSNIYESIDAVHNNLFVVSENDAYVIIDAQGERVVEGIKYRPEYLEGGYWYLSAGDSNYKVLDSERILHKSLAIEVGISHKLTFGKKRENGYEMYIYKDKDYTLELENAPDTLTVGLISEQQNLNGLYAVYEVFSGEKLLDYEYDKIKYLSGYVYAYKGEIIEVYEVVES